MQINPTLGPGDCPRPGMWYVISSIGHHPTARVGHTCSYLPGKSAQDKGKLVVIGGADPSGAFSDTYLLDLESYQWTTPGYSGLSARYEHTVFQPVSQPNKIFLFGGADQGKNMNDLQVLDLESAKWTTASVTGTSPSPRTCRNCASIGDKLYVFGGGNQGAEPVSDRQLHVFNAETMAWTCPEVGGKKPAARHGHVMVAIGTKLYLHGGMAQEIFFSDLHEFDTETSSWKQIRCKGDIPLACTGHGAIALDNKMIIFGGMTPNGALDVMYAFNTATSRWQKMKIEGAPPASRLDFAMCASPLFYDKPIPEEPSLVSEPSSEKLVTIFGGDPPPQEGTLGQVVGKPEDTQDKSRGVDTEDALDRLTPTEGAVGTSTCANEVDLLPPSQEGAVGDSQGKCVVCVVHGGMDTEGEIFDDCLVLRLDDIL